MGLETKEIEIDGRVFAITQLPFRKSKSTLVFFTKKIAPGLSGLLSGFDDLGAAKEAISVKGKTVDAAIVRAVTELASTVDDDDLEALAEAFGAHCKVRIDGEPGKGDQWIEMKAANRDFVFMGPAGLSLFFKWLVACFKVNYSDFLSAWTDLGGDPAKGSRAKSERG